MAVEMTREEAIKELELGSREVVDYWYLADPTIKKEAEIRIEALNMGIEALKQELILDKIRAEIEQKCCITVRSENEPAITLYDVFQIIDKYKAESEE